MKFVIKILLFIFVSVGIYFVLSKNQNVFQAFLAIDAIDIILLLTINLLFLITFALFQNKILLIFGLQQTSKEWVGLGFIAAFYNLFLPAKGGSALRSAYLKKKYGFTYKKFVAYLIKQSIYILIVASFMIGLLLLLVSRDIETSYFQLIAVLTILFSAAVYLSEKQLIYWLAKRKKINSDFIVPKQDFWVISSITLILIVLKGTAFYIAFLAISYPIAFEYSLLIASVVMVLNLVSIIPGNIGIREFVMGGVLQLFGYSLSLVIIASLLDRAATIIVTMIGAIVYKYILLKDANI